MKYGNVELHNVCAIVEDDGQPGVGISRLPLELLPDINKNARRMSRLGSACEIRGMLPPGGEAKVVLQVMDDNTTPPVITVYHGCFCDQSIAAPIGVPLEITIKEPDRLAMMAEIAAKQAHAFDPRLVRVKLSPVHPVRILSIEGDLSYPIAGATPAKTLLSYGSSITHGSCAVAPESTYAAQCARLLGYDLINLGSGGSAHMEVPIAKHIAAREDWDVATFEMGINVRDWPVEKFHGIVETFVQTVVSAQPEKPVFCIDLFTYFDDFTVSPQYAVGFRDAVRDIVQAIDSPHVHYIDGRDLLAHASGLRTDMVHPSDEGMLEIGQNLARVIRAEL